MCEGHQWRFPPLVTAYQSDDQPQRGNAVKDFQNGTNVTCHCIGVFSDAVSSNFKLAIQGH